MKKILFLMIAAVFTSLAFAADGDLFDNYREEEIPLELKLNKSGFPEAPVVVCPRPLKKYSDLLDQLNSIKTKIQSEACKDSSIKVDSLENLVGQKRVEFVDLIKKGVFGDGQLSADEVSKVKTYVNNIVTKAADLAGLVKNEACFDDADKQSTLGFLSGVISEVSGAVGVLAGPFGAKISLIGGLAGTFLESVDAIVQARTTYDYGDPDDINIDSINSYMNNLCTYYDFKPELDIESDLVNERIQFVKIYRATEFYLEKIQEDCESCRLIAADYQARLARRAGFDLDRVSEAPGGAVRGTDAEEDVAAPEAISEEDVIVAVEDLPYGEMVEYFERLYADSIAEDAPADGLVMEEPVIEAAPVAEGDPGQGGGDLNFLPPAVTWIAPLPPHKATIRALQIQNWAKGEIIKIDELNRDSTGFDGRGKVAEVQAEIENFLARSEARKYLKFRTRVHKARISELERIANEYLVRRRHLSMSIKIPEDPDSFFEDINYRNAAELVAKAFHEANRYDIDFADILMESQWFGYENVEDFRQTENQMVAEMNRRLFAMVDSHGVLHRKCEFFQKSLFGKSGALESTCNRAQKQLAVSQAIGNNLHYTSFADFNMGSINPIFEDRPNFQASYVASVKWSLCRDIDNLGLEDEEELRYIKRLCE